MDYIFLLSFFLSAVGRVMASVFPHAFQLLPFPLRAGTSTPVSLLLSSRFYPCGRTSAFSTQMALSRLSVKWLLPCSTENLEAILKIPFSCIFVVTGWVFLPCQTPR